MLNGKVSVITGASRGIGAAIAKKLASLGADTALVYNGSEEKALQVKADIFEKYSILPEVYKCDVSDSEQCRQTVKEIVTKYGKIDILINNAGITRDSLLLTMSDEDFDAVVNTNLKGCFNMIKACSRSFIKNNYGKIVNISSVSALKGLAGQANYSSSKAGIIALTKVTARELGAKNVCCNAIAPGFITTDMTRALKTDDEFISSIPLKRLGRPEDVANLAAFLVDGASDYITGEVIRIDGGLAI